MTRRQNLERVIRLVEFHPKTILTMFGCDVHLTDDKILNSSYDNLDYEVLQLRLNDEEVSLVPNEVAQLRDYCIEWLKADPKTKERKESQDE